MTCHMIFFLSVTGNHRIKMPLQLNALTNYKFTNRPITKPGGGIAASGAGDVVCEDKRRHASLLANSTLAISVATHSGRSGIAQVIMNRRVSMMCCNMVFNIKITLC